MNTRAIILGGFCVGMGALIFWRIFRLRHWPRVGAKVMAVDQGAMRATLALDDSDPPRSGSIVQIRHRSSTGSMTHYPQVGDWLTVIHPPGRPDELQFEPSHLWAAPLGAAGILLGAVILLLG